MPTSRNKAFVLGRIGLVRSLGRVGIPVTLARESPGVFERWSRYCKEFLLLPHLVYEEDRALKVILDYGLRQEEKPVVFLSAESDVLMFSRNRDELSEYFHITLPPHELLLNLVDKGKFARLARAKNLPVPRTVVPQSQEEFSRAAQEIGYPCVIKPISQRLWHQADVHVRAGNAKAILVRGSDELKSVLQRLAPPGGRELIQEYIPGDDSFHYSLHIYIDKSGTVRGSLVGQKLRTFPIHFGQGCYTKFAQAPEVERICVDSLQSINYTGVATVNVKRHAETGKDYILEVNPRYSLWGILDFTCGVNLPFLQYCDAIGLDSADQRPHGCPRRWLWFARDFKAMIDYGRAGELTLGQWLISLFAEKGAIEFHTLAKDDPLPLLGSAWYSFLSFLRRGISYIKRRL